SFFPVFLSVSPYSKKGGAIVVFRDITLQKKQEEELSKKNDKLKLTIESSHIGIWEWDLVKDVIVFDKNIFDILEYDRGFVLNRKSFFDMVHTSDLFRLKGVFNNELIFNDEFKIEIRVQRVDKSYAWVEVRGKIIQKDKNGDPMQLIGTFNDITHIKEYEEILEDEVKQKTKELETINKNLEYMISQEVEKNRQKDILLQQQSRLAALGEMIGNIAHQWRQPLSAITAAISGLKLKFDLGIMEPCDVEEINNHVMQNARFLSSTIENFRNFFKQDMEKKTFVVSDVLEDSIKIIKAAYDSNFIKIEKQIDKTVHYYGSDNMLSQVVLNILSNAKDAFNNQSNNVDKEVFVLLYRDGDDIFIKIKDNAGGISDEIKDKIFDPYFTTKHQSQGTGLGLYMSTQIIRNHFGGDIKVDNVGEETKKGASFEISFPFFEDENTKRVINE
ncbi:MAG: ATP-binding protein, partial [Arcobacteraceae bacterium]